LSYAKQYRCPECNEYGNAKLWDEETIKHYDEGEQKYVLSIETDDENSCEFYCFNCKSLVNGKNIWVDVEEEKINVIKISKVIVDKLPIDCSPCTLHEGEYCKIKGSVTGSEWIGLYSDSRDGDCPLEED